MRRCVRLNFSNAGHVTALKMHGVSLLVKCLHIAHPRKPKAVRAGHFLAYAALEK
jgi:hypothetical protein